MIIAIIDTSYITSQNSYYICLKNNLGQSHRKNLLLTETKLTFQLFKPH